MSIDNFGGGPFSQGDQVQQVAQVGLGQLDGLLYVHRVDNGELEISKTENGPPLTDLKGAPRHYPPHAFRKICV